MNGQHEVLDRWANLDLVPLKGISHHVTDLNRKKHCHHFLAVIYFCLSKVPVANPHEICKKSLIVCQNLGKTEPLLRDICN